MAKKTSVKLPKNIFKKFNRSVLKKVVYIFLTLLAVSFLVYRFRSKFLAGMVNGEPIFKFQLSSRLNSQYGKAVLEDLIVERLVYQEAKTKSVRVSKEEIQGAIEKIKSQLGETGDLDSLLATQGIKKADFEHQLETQILVQKLLEGQITTTEEEINKFINENKKQMVATTEAEMAEEARQQLKQQKISTELNSWISGLVKKAKIVRLIN